MHTNRNRSVEAAENIFYKKKPSKQERRRSFTLENKIRAVHEIIVKGRKLVDVAKEYHRSPGLISSFVKRVRSNKQLLRDGSNQRIVEGSAQVRNKRNSITSPAHASIFESEPPVGSPQNKKHQFAFQGN